jgi:hypothetical protein
MVSCLRNVDPSHPTPTANRSSAEPDGELYRLLLAEKDARERYAHIKVNFTRKSEVVEHARLIWMEATAAVLKYQEHHGA